MNGRAFYRIYVNKVHGKEAKEFVSIENEPWYPNCAKIITRDSKGNGEETDAHYDEMLFWLIRNLPNEVAGFLEELS